MAKPAHIDDYLDQLGDHFARPILNRVRTLIREIVPEVEEKIKWGSPSYEYKGLMISTVAFKERAAVWFHKGALLNDPENLLEASSESTKAMRKYQVSRQNELNEKGLKELIREARKANESGAQVEGYGQKDESAASSPRLEEALKANAGAKKTYNELSDSRKREYITYIETAKQEATRQRRLEKSLKLLAQGLGLNDKYR